MRSNSQSFGAEKSSDQSSRCLQSPLRKVRKYPRRYGCCCCCSSCLWIPLLFLLRLFGASVHDCGLRLSGVGPSSGTLDEWVWMTIHWVSLRTFTAFQFVIPGYANVQWYAHAHPEGSTPRCSITIHDAVGGDIARLEELLNAFSDLGIVATFFVIAYPDLTRYDNSNMLRRIVESGHEIGNHGLADKPMWQMSEDEFRDAVLQWEVRVRSVVPQWPARSQDRKWFSPPRGLMSATMASVLDALHYDVVIGDVYTNDAHIDNIDFHVRAVTGSTCDGSVLIFHVPDIPQRVQTIDVLKTAIPVLQERGFSFLRLTDMFNNEGGGFWGACGIGLIAKIMLGFAFCTPLAICLLCCGSVARKICFRICGACPRSSRAQDQGQASANMDSLSPIPCSPDLLENSDNAIAVPIVLDVEAPAELRSELSFGFEEIAAENTLAMKPNHSPHVVLVGHSSKETMIAPPSADQPVTPSPTLCAHAFTHCVWF